jgi:hypothetical protein
MIRSGLRFSPKQKVGSGNLEALAVANAHVTVLDSRP